MTGLTVGSVVLQDNGADSLVLDADGGATQAFTFATPLADGQGFAVTATAQDPTLACDVDGGVGTIQGADVTTVVVSCACAAGLSSCPDGCVDLTTSANDCGSCGHACPPQNGVATSCASSGCACPSGGAPGAQQGSNTCADDCDCPTYNFCDTNHTCSSDCVRYRDEASCSADVNCLWLIQVCVPAAQ